MPIKVTDWPNELAGKLLEELRKWVQASDLTAMSELKAELSKVRKKRKNDPEALSSALNAIKNKHEGTGVLADKI